MPVCTALSHRIAPFQRLTIEGGGKWKPKEQPRVCLWVSDAGEACGSWRGGLFVPGPRGALEFPGLRWPSDSPPPRRRPLRQSLGRDSEGAAPTPRLVPCPLASTHPPAPCPGADQGTWVLLGEGLSVPFTGCPPQTLRSHRWKHPEPRPFTLQGYQPVQVTLWPDVPLTPGQLPCSCLSPLRSFSASSQKGL